MPSGPEQEDEFEAAHEDLVQRFETRTGSRLGWAARDVLEYKWQYFDANLTEWSVADIEALLFEILPAKVNLGPNDAGDLIAGFAAFLRFLSAEGLLSEGTGERLARRVEDAQVEFEAAMNDEERFGPRQTAGRRNDRGRRGSDGPGGDGPLDDRVQRAELRRATRPGAVAGAVDGPSTPALALALALSPSPGCHRSSSPPGAWSGGGPHCRDPPAGP